jgi:hypothetical protein
MVETGNANGLADFSILETNDWQTNMDVIAFEQKGRTATGPDDESIGNWVCRENRSRGGVRDRWGHCLGLTAPNRNEERQAFRGPDATEADLDPVIAPKLR